MVDGERAKEFDEGLGLTFALEREKGESVGQSAKDECDDH